MAIKAGRTDISRTESLERLGTLGELAFESRLSKIESLFQALGCHGRSLVLVTSFGNIVSGAHGPSGIPFRRIEIADSLSYIFGIRFPFGERVIAIDVASRGRKSGKNQENYCFTIHDAALLSSSSKPLTASMAVCTDASV